MSARAHKSVSVGACVSVHVCARIVPVHSTYACAYISGRIWPSVFVCTMIQAIHTAALKTGVAFQTGVTFQTVVATCRSVTDLNPC